MTHERMRLEIEIRKLEDEELRLKKIIDSRLSTPREAAQARTKRAKIQRRLSDKRKAMRQAMRDANKRNH